jgi:hypothetical protein
MRKTGDMRGAYRLLILAGITLMSACSDAPTALRSASKTVPLKAKRSASYASGNFITIVDDSSSRTLTLDLSANEIQIDDGRVFLLSQDQTAEVATDFQNTLLYDALAADVITAAADHQVCHDTGGCGEEMSRGVPDPASLVKRRGAPRGGQTRKRPMPPMFALGIPNTASKNGSVSGFTTPTFDILSILPDCESMRGDIVTAEANYRNAREVANQRMLDQGMSGFVYEAGRWIKRLTLPEANVIFAAMESDYANKRAAENKMDVMRVLYTSQGCGTISFAGDSYNGFTYQMVNGHTLKCHFEWWQISFDGGSTWRSVGVNVCEFDMQ